MAEIFVRDLVAHQGRVGAVASRSLESARAFSERLGLSEARPFGSWQELLDCPEVEAVYIATPNHLHAEISLAAAAAGKPVLCEKPAALSEAELAPVLTAFAEKELTWMEAFLYRTHPAWQRVRQIVFCGMGRMGDGNPKPFEANPAGCLGIGRPLRLRGQFGFPYDPPEGQYRTLKRCGGGALLDIGVYPLSAMQWLMGSGGGLPQLLDCTAKGRGAGGEGVDWETHVTLEYPGGIIGTFEVSFNRKIPTRMEVIGTRGRLELHAPFTPDSPDADFRLIRSEGGKADERRECLLRGTPPCGGPESTDTTFHRGEGNLTYAREALYFEGLVLAGRREAPVMSWPDSLELARLLDQIRERLELR
jgi:predicted dehydrogenase